MKAALRLTVAVLLVAMLLGCWPFGPSKPVAQFITQAWVGGLLTADPNVRLTGAYADPGYTPWDTDFDGFTNSQGILQKTGIALPGTWLIVRAASANCAGETFYGTVGNQAALHLRCLGGFSFLVTPPSIHVYYPPATMEIEGTGISTEHGMPRVRFYDDYGSYFAEQVATSVEPDGSGLVVATPSFLLMYSGWYAAVVFNVNGSGGLDAIGGASFELTGNDPPEPPPDCQSDPEMPPELCPPEW